MADKPLKIQGPSRPERHVQGEGGGASLSGKLRILGIIGGVVVLVVAGILYFNWQARADNEQAATELGRIRPYFEQGDYAKAIDGDPAKLIGGKPVRGLAAIARDYGSTEAGKAAALNLGDAYMATERFDEAAEAYEIAADAGDNTMKAAGLVGLAAVAEAEGKPAEAAAHYENAATTYTAEFSTPLYLLGAALNYEKAGQNDKAIEHYREIVTRYYESDQTNQARLALARLNVEI